VTTHPILTHFSTLSSNDEKIPVATAASMAVPREESLFSVFTSSIPSISATICLHSGLFAPPPIIAGFSAFKCKSRIRLNPSFRE
jgi:hypothetical protein